MATWPVVGEPRITYQISLIRMPKSSNGPAQIQPSYPQIWLWVITRLRCVRTAECVCCCGVIRRSNPIAVSVRYRTAVILSAERQSLPPQLLLHRVIGQRRTASDLPCTHFDPLSRCIQLRHALKLRAPSIDPAILGSMVNSQRRTRLPRVKFVCSSLRKLVVWQWWWVKSCLRGFVAARPLERIVDPPDRRAIRDWRSTDTHACAREIRDIMHEADWKQ